MKGRNAQISRIYTILNILEHAPHGLSVTDLCERLNNRGFEVVKRTVYRDLDALRGSGFPLNEKGQDDDNGTRWALEKTTKVNNYLVLTARELMALYFARSMLSPLKETPFFDDLTTTFHKIEEKLSIKGKNSLEEVSKEFHFEPGAKWGLGLNPDIIETIRAACTEGQKLKVNYSSTNSQTTKDRILGPHFLYFGKGSLYLVAKDFSDGIDKTFSLPRVNQAQMLDEEFESKNINPDTYFDSAFGVYHSKNPVEVKLEFSSPISTYIKERRWHDSQRIITKENGKIELTFEVGITPELVQWVLGYGKNVKVLSPTSLKKEIKKQAKETLEIYQELKSAS